MVTKRCLFKIEDIDLENGSCTVRFINKNGAIETNKKRIKDFEQLIDVPTGSFNLDGTPIFQKKKVLINDNPNEDLIYSIDIPLNELDEYVEPDELIEHIAKQYPHDIFETIHKKKKATRKQNLIELKQQKFNIELTYSDPIVEEINPNFDPSIDPKIPRK